jgi:hypothetical protein
MMKRKLILTTAIVGVAVALPANGVGAVAFAQPAPPTLTEEFFHQDRPTVTSGDCTTASLNFSYSATGTASGPYPGTFTESGSMTSTQLAASFTIDSPVGRVTGTKSGQAGVGCALVPPCSGAAACENFGASFNTVPFFPTGFSGSDTYQATITTANGAFSDNGLFSARFYHGDTPNPLDGFDETFQSALEAPVPGCQGRIVAEFNHNSGEAGASGNPNASAGPGYFLGPNTASAVHEVMQDFCG